LLPWYEIREEIYLRGLESIYLRTFTSIGKTRVIE